MKFLLAAPFFILLCLAGCAAPAEQPVAGGTQAHTAMNSLDFEGTYKLESANGGEIKNVTLDRAGSIAITLASGQKASGRYEWGSSGLVILCDVGGQKLSFFVGENFLRLLKDGPQKGAIFRK